jgi:hypothetical protein
VKWLTSRRNFCGTKARAQSRQRRSHSILCAFFRPLASGQFYTEMLQDVHISFDDRKHRPQLSCGQLVDEIIGFAPQRVARADCQRSSKTCISRSTVFGEDSLASLRPDKENKPGVSPLRGADHRLTLSLSAQAIRYLRLWSWKRRPVGRRLIYAIPCAFIVSSSLFLTIRFKNSGYNWSRQRAQIVAELNRQAGRHLVIASGTLGMTPAIFGLVRNGFTTPPISITQG